MLYAYLLGVKRGDNSYLHKAGQYILESFLQESEGIKGRPVGNSS